jgi:hypothetical protein
MSRLQVSQNRKTGWIWLFILLGGQLKPIYLMPPSLEETSTVVYNVLPQVLNGSQSLYPPLSPVFLQPPFNQRVHILYSTYGNVD